jgi:hypothetical protein
MNQVGQPLLDRLAVDAYWAVKEEGSRAKAIRQLIAKGHAESAAAEAVRAAIADIKRDIRRRALTHIAIGVGLGLIAPAVAVLTHYVNARLAVVSAVGAALALYGVVQIVFATGMRDDNGSV